MSLNGALCVALGSALGGVGRYWLVGLVDRYFDGAFPWGTLAVNVLGSCLIGLLAVALLPQGRIELGDVGRLTLIVGLLGGFTTFSAFSLQTLSLLQTGQVWQAGCYVGASVLLCVTGAWLGYGAGMLVLR